MSGVLFLMIGATLLPGFRSALAATRGAFQPQ